MAQGLASRGPLGSIARSGDPARVRLLSAWSSSGHSEFTVMTQQPSGGPTDDPDQPRRPADPMPAMNPGDQAPPGTPGTGENVCRVCGGSGRLDDDPCPSCGGTGK